MPLNKKSLQNPTGKQIQNPTGIGNVHPQPPAVNATPPNMQVIKVPGGAKRP